MTRVKMEDVAKLAGVSKSTVSQFLNKRYEFMSEETRGRIENAIKSTGYQPNVIARSLKVKKTNTIGVIVANILHYFSTAVSRGIEDYCNKHHYNVILCNADDNPQKERIYLEMLLAKQVDGIICATTGKNNELLKDLINREVPLVLIDRKLAGIEMDGVFSNNEQGARDAVAHLLAIGHRRIALLSPDLNGISTRQGRFKGYRQTLIAHGLQPMDEYIKFVKSTAEVKESISDLLHMPEPPTAILCTNDLTTMEALHVLKQGNVKVPETIAIIGFDDSPWVDLLDPPLTTVNQQTYEIGLKSAEQLLTRIEHPQEKKFHEQILDCHLTVRKSCGIKN
jgi:LacI family transcriptional regulator, kdg operon repressor